MQLRRPLVHTALDVAMLSMMMAVEMGYDEQKLYNVGLGAFLHDIGKLLVPKSILEKPGDLSEIEAACVRQHCELGKSSLQGFNFPKDITDIVLQHHERLDGSGYPDGLKDNEISFDAKIVMIADTFDILTSYLPCKKPDNISTAFIKLKVEKEKYSQELISVLGSLLVF